MDKPIPWPRPGDVLFSEDGGWSNACVGWTRDQWIGYIEGYKRAADILVQHVVDTGREQDFLVYPIVFLYRQAIEVSLKQVIRVGSQLLDRKEKLPAHHRLIPLWQVCRPIIEQVWPSGAKADLNAVEEVLKQFEARDPGSTVFRYPVSKDGRASVADSERIDLENFAAVANRTLALLDGCACGMAESIQRQWEMEREYSD